MRRPKRCPACRSERIVEIAYGMPGPEAEASQRRGEIILGGCIVGPDSPEWGCADCGTLIEQPPPRSVAPTP